MLSSCEQGGYINAEIKNLASSDIFAEGFNHCEKSIYGGLSCSDGSNVYEGDLSRVIGLSSYGFGKHIGTEKVSNYALGNPINGREVKSHFPKFRHAKFYYKSKTCLILEISFLDLYPLYEASLVAKEVLVFTSNGLEVISKEEYESKKGTYTINDKNVKCIKHRK